MFEIIKKALSKLKESLWLFYLLPGVLALAIGTYTYFFDKSLNLFGDVVGPIGIFSALMFSVIFIVVEHFLKRKEDYSSDNDEDVRYLRNYQDFTKDTVALISFSIFLAGWIILLAFIRLNFGGPEMTVNNVIDSADPKRKIPMLKYGIKHAGLKVKN